MMSGHNHSAMHAGATLSLPPTAGKQLAPRSRHTQLPEMAPPGSLSDGGANGSAAVTPRFTAQTLKRDALAGSISGLMAIPLTVGICLMSEYPVQLGLATVIVACVISFVLYLVRPGNHIGVPGVAAGL